MIRIIGLGVQLGDISVRGLEAVNKCNLAIFKTNIPATYGIHERIDVDSITLDDVFISGEDFDDVNNTIVERLLEEEAKHGDIAYLVGGSGSDDRSVQLLIDKGADVLIYPASSKEATFHVHDTSYLAISAYDLVAEKVFMPDTAYPVIIKDIDNQFTASMVKLILSDVFDDDTDILMTTLDGEKSIKLYELDRQSEYNYYTAIYLKASDYTTKKKHTFSDLLRIMYRLRDRETGCAWDKVQTHESIRRNVIEESYELVNAIDNKDIDNILEECGDIMLQSVFHSVIAEDMGEFDMADVISGLCNKLVTRHTHIFGDVVANNSEEALKAWENAKAKEKSQKDLTQKLEGIAIGLPQIMRAEKVQKQASKVGLDFPNIDEAIDKVHEELREFLEAKDEDKELEAGDLLFAVINILRMSKVEGEVALRRSIDKFQRRIINVDKYAKRDGKSTDKLTLDEFNAYWDEAKQDENR